MFTRFKQYLPVILVTLGAWSAMFIACFSASLPFSAYRESDFFAPFMYWISESGGVYGTGLLLLIIAVIFTVTAGEGKKLASFFGLLFGLGALLGGLAAFNERVVKPAVSSPRPSHVYLEEKGIVSLKELYTLDDETRTDIMQKRIEKNPEAVDHVYEPILEHWTFESGFSFPSGHSQNAFLLSVIVAFLVYSRASGGYRWLIIVPLAWAVLVCVSRVAIGIHTKYDVMAGASVGMIIAFLVASTGVLDAKRTRRTN